jgi:hypothetical protein
MGRETEQTMIEISKKDAEKILDFISLLADYIKADPAGPGLIAQPAEMVADKIRKQM